jgi:hypothetical protein
VPWIRALLTNKSTKIGMPEGLFDRRSTGIYWGSLLSLILYLINNAGLLEGTMPGSVMDVPQRTMDG